MPRCSIVVAGLLACLWHAAPLVFAQGYPTELVGTVRDDSGRPARGVPVVVEDERGVARATVKTDPQGFYLVSGLMPGCYLITVADYPQFAPQRRVAIIAQNFATTVNVTLEMRLAEVQQVTVDIDALLGSLGTWDSSVGLRFTRQAIESSPLTHGRNLQSFLDAVPGIVFTESFANGGQFTAVGQRRFSNRLTIDGANADLGITTRGTDLGNATGSLPAFATSGGTQTLVPLSAIDEIQVRTTNATSEYARTPGAQVSVITRSGGQSYHGEATVDTRPNALGAASWIANAGPDYFGLEAPGTARPTSYWNAGATLGGPIWPRRLTMFSAWERQAIRRAVTTTFDTPSMSLRESAAPAFRGVLDAFPMPNGPEIGGGLATVAHTFPTPSNLSVFSVRVDGHLPSGHSIFARFNSGQSRGDFWDTTNRLPFPSAAFVESASLQTLTIGAAFARSNLLHDLRVNFSTHVGSVTGSESTFGNAQPLPLQYFSPPSVPARDIWMTLSVFPGLAGRIFSGTVNDSQQRQFQLIDTVTVVRGKQEWRLGIDYRRLNSDSAPAPHRYLYRFANLARFLQGQPASIVRDYLLPARTRVEVWSAFGQTTFRATENFSVDLGVRYSVKPAPQSRTETEPLLFDGEALPALRPLPSGTPLFKTSWVDFAPRIAATYRQMSPRGRDTLLRTAFSVAFDERAGAMMRAFGDGYPFTAPRFFQGGYPTLPTDAEYSRPQFGDAGSSGNAYAAPATFRTPRTYQWEIGLERALSAGQRFAATYVGTAGRALPYWTMEYYPGSPFHHIHAYGSEGTSSYNALLVNYVRRAARGPQWTLAYAWSHALDLDSGEGVDPRPPVRFLPPSDNRGSADFDRRHVLRVTGSFESPRSTTNPLLRPLCAWKMDVVASVVSGAAVTVVAVDADADFGVYTLRPDVVPGQPVWIEDSRSPTGRRINSAAFALAGGQPGNLGRNTLRGPTLQQIDLSLSRRWRISDTVTLGIRVDAYNVLNRPNVGPPDGNLNSAMFGLPYQTYADALGTGTLTAGGLMPLQQTGAPRSIQIGGRISW